MCAPGARNTPTDRRLFRLQPSVGEVSDIRVARAPLVTANEPSIARLSGDLRNQRKGPTRCLPSPVTR